VKRAIGWALAASLLAISPAAAQSPERPARILFIGNSFTYVNDVPGIVAGFARAAGLRQPICRSVVAGGFSLEDHWDKGAAQKVLEEEKWDFVVLQQGPSASPEGRGLLIRYARRFAPLIGKAGAKPALYMVWPSTARLRDFGDVSDSYRLAAQDIGGVLLPAGDAWRIAEKKAPGLKLYSADGLHPTPAGSYLAAAVIYARLFDKSPAGLPSRLTLPSGAILELPASDAAALLSSASQAIGR
jgi:hypothetical protein